MIEIQRLHFRYPESMRDALVDVNLSIPSGTFALLAGPSGSGKSTLLRTINGLIPHFHGGFFSGSVLIEGRDTRGAAPRDIASSVGTVFQDPESQIVTDTAEDEMAFALENLGFDRREIPKRITEVCARLGIEHLRRRRVTTFSGGERQLVALAAALAPRPGVLLLDEPTSQLDPANALRIIETLNHLNAKRGLSVVIAEHRLARLLEHASTIHMAQQGRVFSIDLASATLTLQRQGLLPCTPDPARRDATTTAGDVIATLRQVEFSYGDRKVLDGLDLTIREGETIALVGPNGSGKTTLIKHLIGLLRPDAGAFEINGIEQSGRPVQRIARTVGYVPQQATLMLHQETAAGELRFTLDALDRTGSISGELANVGLSGLASRHPLDLSGGERQRLAIAALSVARPRLLLLDEPTRGLPWALKRDLASFLRGRAAAGCAVIAATHDEDFARAFASRRIVLTEGRVTVDDLQGSAPVSGAGRDRDNIPLLTGTNLD